MRLRFIPEGGELACLALCGLLLCAVGVATFMVPPSASFGALRISVLVLGATSALFVAVQIIRHRRATLDPRALFGSAPLPWEPLFVFVVALCLLVPGIWSYTLIDPWEGHYAEVARLMLEGHDWVHTKWQNEVFRSKPVLTFWLIASSLRFFGLANDGGYSGEIADSEMVIFAVRLPFVVFGAVGISAVWWMLAHLLSRKTAWIFAAVITTTTFFFSVARQAITDMPMVAMTMVAIACFAMTVERGQSSKAASDESPKQGFAVFAVFFVLATLGQALYYAVYFAHHPAARGLTTSAPPSVLIAVPIVLAALALAASARWFPVTRRGQVWMFWFYAAVGIGVLAKGPPTLALSGVVCLTYLILTKRWSLLWRLEIPRGIAITAVIAVPWHAAMLLRDGPVFINQYIGYHMMDRFAKGALGDRGTFEYVFSQLGIGMWPWAGLVALGFAAILFRPSRDSCERRTELLIGIWAVSSVAFFCFTTTKFHHYILPATPACAILVALWIKRALAKEAISVAAFATAVVITAVLTMELVGEQEKLIELYIYRYDRPWPSGAPWNLDISRWLLVFGVLFSSLFCLAAIPRLRKWALIASLLGGVMWLAWGGTFYMQAAAPHWGQRALHQSYLADREILGAEIRYNGLRELANDWGDSDRTVIRSVIPMSLVVGQSKVVRLAIPNAGLANNRIDLAAKVTSIEDEKITLTLEPGELERIASLVETGKTQTRKGAPTRAVLADRLIAWELNWRGENFWSGGSIWGPTPATRLVFNPYNGHKPAEFDKFIRDPAQAGQRYYVVTEAGRARGLKNKLPTARAKETFTLLDTSNNKFTLVRFDL